MPNDFDNLEPVTREEAFLDEIATGENILDPVTRKEAFLKMIAQGKAGETFPDLDPITRREYFLKKIAESFTGGGGEMESGTYTPESDTLHPTIALSETHDRAPDLYYIANISVDADNPPGAAMALWMVYINWETTLGKIYEGTNEVYGIAGGVYWYNSATFGSNRLNYPVATASAGKQYSAYYVAADSIKPFVQDTRKFKAANNYKWYAFWL